MNIKCQKLHLYLVKYTQNALKLCFYCNLGKMSHTISQYINSQSKYNFDLSISNWNLIQSYFACENGKKKTTTHNKKKQTTFFCKSVSNYAHFILITLMRFSTGVFLFFYNFLLMSQSRATKKVNMFLLETCRQFLQKHGCVVAKFRSVCQSGVVASEYFSFVHICHCLTRYNNWAK